MLPKEATTYGRRRFEEWHVYKVIFVVHTHLRKLRTYNLQTQAALASIYLTCNVLKVAPLNIVFCVK